MNYEEKYNEILAWARKNKARLNGVPIEEVLPELRESEDERIRKELVEAFEALDIDPSWNGIPVKSILAWLEKHKENPKSANSISSNCTSCAKCEDRDSNYGVFPEDALVVARACEKLEAHGYLELAHALINVNLYTKEQKPWKVGANAYFTPEQKPAEKHDLVAQLREHLANATKEQLEAEWKELEKWNDVGPTVEEYLGGIKPAEYIKRNSKEWYSLLAEQYDKGFWKGKAEQKPAEWSEEDEKYLNRVINLWVNDFGEDSDTVKWLKSLRPHWKPSEEELGRKHLDGYCMGREDTLREMKDFIESHFNCENAKKGTPIVYNTQSGTSTLKAEG